MTFSPGDRVRLLCDGKTLRAGTSGTIIPSMGPGGFVDVCWSDGQVRGHGRDWLEKVPADTSPEPAWGSHDEAFVAECVRQYVRIFRAHLPVET